MAAQKNAKAPVAGRVRGFRVTRVGGADLVVNLSGGGGKVVGRGVDVEPSSDLIVSQCLPAGSLGE